VADELPMGTDFALVELDYRLWEEAHKGRRPALPFEDTRVFKVRRVGVAQSQSPEEVYKLTVKLERTA
jgi:hypothetical protein